LPIVTMLTIGIGFPFRQNSRARPTRFFYARYQFDVARRHMP